MSEQEMIARLRAAREWALDCGFGNHADAIRDTLTTLASRTPEGMVRYRHKKRGTTYEVLGVAELQAEQPQVEKAALTIYRGDDGKLWARNTAEFHDGRFELAPTPSGAE